MPHRCLASFGLVALLVACGGGGEEGASEESAETAGETASGPSSEVVDRQIELWNEMIAELEKITDEESARAAVPRLTEIATEASNASASVDTDEVGMGTPEQTARLTTVRDRYVAELTRISQEAPAALPIIGDALASVERPAD